MSHPSPDPSSSPSGRPGRRALIAGAAWAAPVVAVSVTAPAIAASGEPPTLFYEQPEYTVSGCGVLDAVIVLATTDGSTPAPVGTQITVTLPSGFSFVDGTASPVTLTVEGGGRVQLPSIKAPVSAGSVSLEATSEGLSATASVALTSAIGTRLYAGAVSFVPDFQAVPQTGLPSGYAFQSIHATDGAVFATLGDGSLWVARENPTTGTVTGPVVWYDTGLDGDAGTALMSSSPSVYYSLIQISGALHTVYVPGTWTTAPTVSPLANPPGGAPVQLGVSNGLGTYYAESADGRLWFTPQSGAARGVWTQILGYQAPVKDWFVQRGNSTETLWVIDANGQLFGNPATTGARPTALTNSRHPAATWTAPLSHFAKNHADSAMGGSGAAFVDATGGMYRSNGSQNVNYGGVLDGRLGGLEMLRTVDSLGATTNTIIHVIDGGRLYAADLSNNLPFADITPPASLLGGASIVDAHSTGSGLSGPSFAIGSDSRVWVSNRYLSGTPTWTLAGGLPPRPEADGIIQDGKFTYVLGEPDSCPS